MSVPVARLMRATNTPYFFTEDGGNESNSHLEKRLDLLAGLEVVQPPPLFLLFLLGLLAAAVALSLVIRFGRAPGHVQCDGRLGHAGHGVEYL